MLEYPKSPASKTIVENDELATILRDPGKELGQFAQVPGWLNREFSSNLGLYGRRRHLYSTLLAQVMSQFSFAFAARNVETRLHQSSRSKLMKTTLSIIKADIGSLAGHMAPSKLLQATVGRADQRRAGVGPDSGSLHQPHWRRCSHSDDARPW